ncbi:MAG: antibiotic biosynthesis monooxygenase [Myxococcota bacterium]
MPSVVATIKVQEDKIEEAKAFMKQLASDTLASESGTQVYTPHQRQDDPTTFVFYEKYENAEAFAIHGKNLAAKGKEFGALLAGPPEIVMLEEL